ncbi:ribonucleoside-diphosphate reductase [Loktanella phage pCB2051-A]|uniref:Vitamin B12-dependent ribonucleotide reductase n=1 Tax=Loktanella phage pCB2051-A TaxID=754044 RepID=M4QT32_9CAUD|nr:ribonucleotide reductase [Loktanella phage pCB2051-A]AGH31504.1 ribonucleoside-diphosphate reductase [Loktanella phage pCB2051-A]
MTRFSAPIAAQIWDSKYRFKQQDGTPIDQDVEDTWLRIATDLAACEGDNIRPQCEEDFYNALEDFKYLPAGRITAGAGTGRNVTLFNCFVMGTVPDDMGGIFDMLKEAALTMQQGGGIGYDFSTIRPKGAIVKGVAADASGPLSFMDVWDAMCRTIMSAGSRRGAMMATMRCDHPDIKDFITAKSDPNRLRMFNMSVLITDAFMKAKEADEMWDLVFEGKVYSRVRATELWDAMMKHTYDVAEPGVLFIDRINNRNNLNYCEVIAATNPCGEQPLPPYGACLLGSINMARMVKYAFTEAATIDLKALDKLVRTAIRMMDNVVDTSKFPLPAQDKEAHDKRRLGLGVTGLADALIMLGLTYGTDDAASMTDDIMHQIARSAYLGSVDLAKEKGAFPLFDADKYLAGENMMSMDQDVRDAIREHGIRNALLTSIAPTGTISLYAGNVSSGIEPVFANSYTRKVLEKDGTKRPERVDSYSLQQYIAFCADNGKPTPDVNNLPPQFVNAQTLTPEAHIVMQAAAQRWIDSSISKTINLPEDISFEDFKDVYMMAWESGCKGCTTYRPNAVTGSVLSVDDKPEVTELAGTPTGLMHDQPMARPDDLEGGTYKLKYGRMQEPIYITVNHITVEDEKLPFEVFINTKSQKDAAWTIALTLLITAIFRRGGDVRFAIEDLKGIVDPRGGDFFKGKFQSSVIAAIAMIIETHLIRIGYIKVEAGPIIPLVEQGVMVEAPQGDECPSCGEFAMQVKEGCATCGSCSYSACG